MSSAAAAEPSSAAGTPTDGTLIVIYMQWLFVTGCANVDVLPNGIAGSKTAFATGRPPSIVAPESKPLIRKAWSLFRDSPLPARGPAVGFVRWT